MSAEYSSRFARTNSSRSASSAIAWIWLKKTALIAASGPITAIEAVGRAMQQSGSNAGPAIA